MNMEPKHIHIKDYNYPLPDERIAKFPLSRRDTSKLLVYRHGDISQDTFHHLPDYLPKGALMIFNNTHFVTDFSFLKEAPHIKTLIISGVRILDTQFLKHLPELEFLVLDTCRLKNIEFDFISLQKLRFIDLSNNDLASFPNLKSIDRLNSPLFIKIDKGIVKISKENTLPKEMEDLGDRF